MNKINVLLIIEDHFSTLRDSRGKTSHSDRFTFVAPPILLYAASIYLGVELKSEVYAQSISVFSIFSALLFSAQVAIFTLTSLPRRPLDDKVSQAIEDERWGEKLELFRQINLNISYLILLSCVGISLLLLFFAFPLPADLEAALTLALFVHFLSSLLMVVKRTHVAFSIGYRYRRQEAV